jgi:hypothetical protein
MAKELDLENAWAQLVAKAWADPALKSKLLADPVAALKEIGVIVPPGITVKVAQNTDKVINLVLPVKPEPEELTEDELRQAAGGGCRHSNCVDVGSDPGDRDRD